MFFNTFNLLIRMALYWRRKINEDGCLRPCTITQFTGDVEEKEQKAVCETQVKDRKDLLHRKQGHVASDQLPDQLLQGTRCFALPIA